MTVHLVLIETASNQDFIFATNKLRENIGASEIIYRIGTQFVLEAVDNHRRALARGAGKPEPLWTVGADGLGPHPRILAARLANSAANPSIEAQGGGGVEVVVATSGKALLLVGSRAAGMEIVAAVTRRALEEVPGAVVRGYVSGPFEFGNAKVLDEAVATVHREVETLRAKLPAPEARFAMLPIVAPCQTSGLPAESVFDYGRGRTEEDELADRPRPDDCAAPVRVKRDMRRPGWRRMKMLAEDKRKPKDRRLAQDVSRLEDMDLDWHAVVHADGNGVGAIFLKFLDRSRAKSAREYVDAYRNFSISLELCTLAAFTKALDTLEPRPIQLKKRRTTERFLPLVPLVLGGDDLTIVCDGELAVDFAAAYLKEFEKQSSGKTTVDFQGFNVPKIAGGRLAACAGVAVFKPHFPFHRAYRLAEDLLKSAKMVKRNVTGRNGTKAEDGAATTEPVPCSALDFHVHFDSSGADLESMRKNLDVPGAVLTAKPYVVTPLDDLSAVDDKGRAWVRLRRWESENPHQGEAVSGLLDAAEQLARRGDRDEGSTCRAASSTTCAKGCSSGRTSLTAVSVRLRIATTAPTRRMGSIGRSCVRIKPAKPRCRTCSSSIGSRTRTARGRSKPPADLTWFLDALELAELRGPRKRKPQASQISSSGEAGEEAAS